MERRRNLYYQKQLADQIDDQLNSVISLMTRTLNVHLNIDQNITINTPSILMTLGCVPLLSLPTKVLQHFQPAEIRFPLNLFSNATLDNGVINYRVCFPPSRGIFVDIAVL